jgi:hypothetical protein
MKKLTNFIKPPHSKDSVNKSKVNRFIKNFNGHIKHGEFDVNDGLDPDIEHLNESEFELAKEQAENNGYILTKLDDNNFTTTYRLEWKE